MNNKRFSWIKQMPVLALALFQGVGESWASEFVPLGDLPGGSFWSNAHAVSDDGNTVVGNARRDIRSPNQAFMWTESQGMRSLWEGTANDVSSDGLTVVGGATDAEGQAIAVVWTGEGVNSLGVGGESFIANAISSDGLVIVGRDGRSDANLGFRWTSDDGVVTLPELRRYADSSFWASGVSADGHVIVGEEHVHGKLGEAVLWNDQQVTRLGHLQRDTYSAATDVSADGSVVIGLSDGQRKNAFRWTQEEGMTSINQETDSVPQLSQSIANGISGDGSNIVGTVSGPAAFIWHDQLGMNFLQDVLVNEFGLGSQLSGWILERANDISANGRYIVGEGINPSGKTEAWLVRLDHTYSVPEPAGFSLMLLGLSPLVLRRNWRRSSKKMRKDDFQRVHLSAEHLEDRTVLSGVPFFMGIGDLPGGDYFSRATGVSGDGLTVVGKSAGTLGEEAFRFTVVDGPNGIGVMQGMGIPDGATSSYAIRASSNGSVIVGETDAASFRWEGGVMTLLPGLPGGGSNSSSYGARGVSSDGSIVVGLSESADGSEGYVWAESTGQLLGIGDLPGGAFNSMARAVSDDGSVVVGGSDGFTVPKKGKQSSHHAIRWTAETGMEVMWTDGYASATSGDGSVIVGYSLANHNQAVRWTEATGATPISGFNAWSVSGDGSVIGGQERESYSAAIWDEANGVRSLQDVLSVDYGLDLTGWELISVWDISDDGSTLVGPATNPQGELEGYIVHLGGVETPPGINVKPLTDLITSEGDTISTASFAVVLNTEPTAPVSIDVTSSNEAEGTVVGATGNVLTLTFDATNWNTPQTVAVQGVDDLVADGDQPYTIQLAPAVSVDAAYSGLDAPDVSVTNLDNDVPPATANDIYVWDIDLQTRKRRGTNEGRIFIDIRNDWNANGVDSFDTGAHNVLVTLTLTGPFETTTYSGYTDSNGVFRSDWISGLAPGEYTIEVIDLAHATLNWNMLLDVEDDWDGDGLPDDVFALL
jgi:uncharacterized membrane protein